MGISYRRIDTITGCYRFCLVLGNHADRWWAPRVLSSKRHRRSGQAYGDIKSLGVGLDDSILEGLKSRTHEADVFAGYFAVCREYVPGGVNGKPPERTTPAGAVVAMESPSVYQSMYRSIFDRNKTTSPSMDASNARSKKARNVFYVVLRYVFCLCSC
jgi:hypothetical protein